MTHFARGFAALLVGVAALTFVGLAAAWDSAQGLGREYGCGRDEAVTLA